MLADELLCRCSKFFKVSRNLPYKISSNFSFSIFGWVPHDLGVFVNHLVVTKELARASMWDLICLHEEMDNNK